MKIETGTLSPGLYFVATPIGAARDITLRALDVLASADVLVAEDTRTLKHLLRLHGITLGDRPVLAYHDHSGPETRDRIVARIAEGRAVAYASEAGTPLVADPGYQLGRAAIDAGLPVTTAPGPSAAIAALTVSGLPSDRFLFAGFAPNAGGPRRKWLRDLAGTDATQIVYESPRRLAAFLADLATTHGADRPVVICRELTKKFEEVRRGTAGNLATALKDQPVKGEVVVLIARAEAQVADEDTIDAALDAALERLSVKDAAAEVAAALNLPRRQVYQAALTRAKK
ncbi:16S rRNA methyltransferase [Actibacterium mucosum KCTC 23349]|uniref:Ribosomal RNA small subunit methyltransferase I n=1 Tax=Actibacterium mucosum KCTC 23349 TaxID=1454373 RepID=A0A037ZF16_9RHOB|nr:16S rRNA (cytidine(1402)-2'-O)-methyltransferase [Actibacterium mucosum]KAJ55065.1 16S rRNA methyltransferase [Actibacterium mucosum KCTC 23349]